MDAIYKKIYELEQQGRDAVLVTVVNKEGEGPALAGKKMLVYAGGEITGTVGGGSLEYLAVKKAREVMQTGINTLEHYNLGDEGEGVHTGMACGGSVSLFFEAITQQKRVYIFGAGHIGKALFELLNRLNLRAVIIDDRKEMIDALEAEGDKIHADFNAYMNQTRFVPESYFVLATYKHRHDGLIINQIFKRGIRTPYIGIVASKKTLNELIASLKKETGENPDMSSIYAPVGLDIGGTDNPWEIVLSIAAEIQAVRYGKKAYHLKDKNK
ncbi:MAG: XdhC family protein [Bacteroidales bacterium]|nr:XdhC family protein [Bacteroidales bacterium]